VTFEEIKVSVGDLRNYKEMDKHVHTISIAYPDMSIYLTASKWQKFTTTYMLYRSF